MASRYRAPPGRASGAADNQDRAAGMSGEHGREDVDCINSACPPCRSCTGPHSRSSGRQPPPRSAPPRPRALPLPTARRPAGQPGVAGRAVLAVGRDRPRAARLHLASRTVSTTRRRAPAPRGPAHPATRAATPYALHHPSAGARAGARARALRHPRCGTRAGVCGADPGGGCRVSARTALCTSLAPLHGARRAAETSGTPT
jgi:hypothetical protein